MKHFLSLQGSRAGFFSDLFTGESCPLRIPFDRPLGREPFGRELRVERLEAEWLRAAVSPIPKPRKEPRPPASRLRKNFMDVPDCRILGGCICENTSMSLFGAKRMRISLKIA